MIKKALWALALLCIVSGCNKKNYDTPPRYERLVNTTFTFEYDFAYADSPSQPLTEAPEMPDELNFRVVLELYEWVENKDNPGTYTYRYYDRGVYTTDQHQLGENGKLYLTGELKVPKTKFTAVIWGDYTRASSPRTDYWYYTFRSGYFNEENNGLRRVRFNPNNEQDENFDVALCGIHTIDFTSFEDIDNAFTGVTMSMDRVLSQFTLIASDLEEYKNSIVYPNTYDANMKPVLVRVDYGTYSLETPLAGYRNSYDGLFQRVGNSTDINKIDEFTPEELNANEMFLASDYLFSDPNLDKQEMIVSIVGPMNVTLSKFKIQVPLERNSKTVIKAPFLTGNFSGSIGDQYGITIVDDFDGTIED